jgi:hypothetical protein
MTFWFMLSANVNTEFDDDFLHVSSKGVPEILVHKHLLHIWGEQAWQHEIGISHSSLWWTTISERCVFQAFHT